MRKVLILAALLVAGRLEAQTIRYHGVSGGTVAPSSFSSPAGTLAIGGTTNAVTIDADLTIVPLYSVGTSDPATCTTGSMFHFRTDSALLKICGATDDNWLTLISTNMTSTSGFGFVIDEDSFASDSATKVPTQQSVKAYVAANAGASFDPGTSVTLYDDFLNGTTSNSNIGSTGFQTAATTGTPTYSYPAPTAGTPFGIFRINSSSGDNTGAAIYAIGSGWPGTGVWDTTNWSLDVLITPGSNATGVTTSALSVGLFSHLTEDTVAEAVRIFYDTDFSTTVYVCQICDSTTNGCLQKDDATNSNTVVSTVTPSAVPTRFRIRQALVGVGGARTIYMRVNNETELTFCASGCGDTLANWPSANDLFFGIIWQTRDAAVRSADLDYIYLNMTGLTRY